jgi:pimeloyl-ACP methyl ester carboxylesterase
MASYARASGLSMTMAKHLVLLPGLDGTGELFSDFVAALPDTISATTVTYPAKEVLPYAALRPFVNAAIPERESFVLLAESFSSPLAVEFAASKPPNLVALIICAGFVFRPLGGYSRLAKTLAWPWLFKVNAPLFILEYFAMGQNAPPALIQKFRRVLRSVSPEVMSSRMREAMDSDARSSLAQTTVPILYIEGTEDHLLADSCLEEMKRIKPKTLIAQVAGPHLLLQSEPQKVAEIVSAFIRKLGIWYAGEVSGQGSSLCSQY